MRPSSSSRHELSRGPLFALISSGLFGVSPVFAKMIVGEMSPALLAGLLYLGSGVALLAVLMYQRRPILGELRHLSGVHRWKLLGATAAGGVIAPLFLVYGIQQGSAFEVSLLLNLESVTTTVIAWLVFREHVGKAVWAGKALLVAGGIIISLSPVGHMGITAAGLLVIGACVFWGIDNNLTRDVEELPPAVFSCVKGLVAGTFNVILALSLPHSEVAVRNVGAAMLIGSMSYGVSLILFIEALRRIGASRTSTYFAVGPFFGMVFAVVLLGDRPHIYQWGAALIMAAGLWVLYRESHEHRHRHEPVVHRHGHRHDEHHRHDHEDDNALEPHEHLHEHEPHEHSHPHYPDIHHRHRHS